MRRKGYQNGDCRTHAEDISMSFLEQRTIEARIPKWGGMRGKGYQNGDCRTPAEAISMWESFPEQRIIIEAHTPKWGGMCRKGYQNSDCRTHTET